MKTTDKLRVKWKDEDITVYYPVGIGTRRDARWLIDVFDSNFTREARERGYDLSTLEFEISPADGNGKFYSQRPRGDEKIE